MYHGQRNPNGRLRLRDDEGKEIASKTVFSHEPLRLESDQTIVVGNYEVIVGDAITGDEPETLPGESTGIASIQGPFRPQCTHVNVLLTLQRLSPYHPLPRSNCC